jgi:hypothetical protein
VDEEEGSGDKDDEEEAEEPEAASSSSSRVYLRGPATLPDLLPPHQRPVIRPEGQK